MLKPVIYLALIISVVTLFGESYAKGGMRKVKVKVKLAKKPIDRRKNDFHNVRRIGGSSTNDEDDEGNFYKRKESKLL